MLLQGVLIAALAILEVVLSAPTTNEKIDPVDLSYFCLHVKHDGEEHNKSPILLIHGLTSSHHDWKGVSQVLALQTGRRVCAVDLRNHGDSPWNNRTDIPAMTADIDHFLNKQNIQNVNIIGHSLGGKIGVHYTLNNPDRVDSLVVEDMRANGVTQVGANLVQGILKYLRQAIQSIPEGSNEDEAKKSILDLMNTKLVELRFNETLDDEAAEGIAIRLVNGKWQWKMNLDILEDALKNPESFLTKSTGLFTGPTLFIYGTASIFDVAGNKDEITELFPNAKLVPVEGAGHILHGRYRQFEEDVIRFLKNVN